jgi:hypothetical protein
LEEVEREEVSLELLEAFGAFLLLIGAVVFAVAQSPK